MNYATLLFPDFALILVGFLVCRHTALNRSVWQKVEALVYYFLFPVLLFHSIVKSPLDLRAASALIAAGLLLAGALIALAFLLPRLLRGTAPVDHAAAAQVAFRFNSFIGLAIAERLAGAEGLQLIAVLIGFCVPIFNIAAVWPMARLRAAEGGPGFVREVLRNPLVIATACGLVANLAGLRIPDWLAPTLSRIGAASIALGLMAAGAGMALSAIGRAPALAVAVLAIRHAAAPLIAFGLVRALGLAGTQAVVLMAFAALPTASSCYVLAARLGFNGPYVAALVTLSTLLGMASLPFALALLSIK